MGLLGRGVTAALAVTAALSGSLVLDAQAEENFALSYERPESGEAYVLLPSQEEEYTVAAGDSLWKIAERLWGDGRLYTELYEANREKIVNPDIIWPDQILRVSRPLYLEKQSGPIGIKWESVYQFDTPRGCSVGTLNGQEAAANFTLFGRDEGYNIACLIREKENTLEGPENYQDWEQAVLSYVEEEYENAVQDLTFEQYLSEEGEIIWLYSYVYTIDLSQYGTTGSMETEVCAGVKQSDHMQADFVGFCTGGADIRNKVRYVTASFEELLPEGGVCNVNDQNMQIYPSVMWEPASFNAIAWVDCYFDDRLMEITGYKQEQKSNKEKLLEQMKEGKGVYGGKKKAGN